LEHPGGAPAQNHFAAPPAPRPAHRLAHPAALNQSARAIRAQMTMFRERFPMLDDVRIRHFWGGWIAITPHFIPTVGALDKRRSVIYGLGYNGHGVAAATAMGRILAGMVQGRINEAAETLSGFIPPLPPEPLRWLIVRGLLTTFNWYDGRIDREVSAMSRTRSSRRCS
jgi:glycine/D-amino acid oxidase-like deaminating enzyme